MKTISRRDFLAGLGIGAVGLCCGTALSACGAAERDSVPAYVSPYDLSNLTIDEAGRASYAEGGVACSKVGVDVSSHQGSIDWLSVARDGIDFAVIRIGYRGTTEGGLFADERFALNLAGAKAVGLPVGAYFFSQATTDAEADEEASFALDALGTTTLDYPLVFDQEFSIEGGSRSGDLSVQQATSNVRTFCERVRDAGYKPMFYGNDGDIGRVDLSALSDIPLWFAEYDVSKPSGQYDFCMWQYSSSGAVSGISNGADMSIYFTDDCAGRPWKGEV